MWKLVLMMIGLFIRRPNQDERFANWETSAAGLREDDEGWVYVPPVPGVHTVILGKHLPPRRWHRTVTDWDMQAT
jgi:hypothetical protein